MTRVAVVGGGITGLVAARDLIATGATVTVVEPGHLGGKVRASAFDGAVLDDAADAFLARVPEGVDLCSELGLAGELVSPAQRRAHVWSRGALRLLPQGQVLGIPTDLDELAASGIVSPAGVEAAAHDLSEVLLAPEGDVAIGALVRARLGDEVAERLVDPLVGGINAGAIDELSLAATVPQIDAAARSGAASLMEACSAQRAAVADPSAPVFYAPRGGMGALAVALASDVVDRGATVARERAVGIERERRGWRVVLGDGHVVQADGVVLAAPAPTVADLLRPLCGRAAVLLAAIPYASVALVAIAVDRGAIDRPLDASGFLVPRTEGRTVTACSWTSAKWPHLAGGATAWLRASVGRDGDESALALGDEALVAAVLGDLSDMMDLRGPPSEVRVTRWSGSFPQYRPGHLERVEAVDADLAEDAPRVVVAGAAMRGLGVPACIRQGRAAARRVAAVLGGAS